LCRKTTHYALRYARGSSFESGNRRHFRLLRRGLLCLCRYRQSCERDECCGHDESFTHGKSSYYRLYRHTWESHSKWCSRLYSSSPNQSQSGQSGQSGSICPLFLFFPFAAFSLAFLLRVNCFSCFFVLLNCFSSAALAISEQRMVDPEIPRIAIDSEIASALRRQEIRFINYSLTSFISLS